MTAMFSWPQWVDWGIKICSGEVCCHNAQGRMRNRKSNSEAARPRDLIHCSHKPECIVTTNPDKSVLITITTWHFQFHLVNVSILHLKHKYRARSESRFTCYSCCYVTWCPLTTGIVAPTIPIIKGRCDRDTPPQTFNICESKSVKRSSPW